MDDNFTNSLIQNSKSAMIAAIEIHNKPLFAYRYEVVVLLVINSWELLLKAYINKYLVDVKLFRKDGTTKPFEECVRCVASNSSKEFIVIEESLKKLYEYRNNCAHFYNEKIDVLVFSLLSQNVFFYSKFLKTYFEIDLSEETNLILLPIGFKKPLSPLDFISSKSYSENTSEAVKMFLASIADSTNKLKDQQIEDSILINFTLSLSNENRIKNADLIAAITKQPTENSIVIENHLEGVYLTDSEDAKKIKIEEHTLFHTVYTMRYEDVIKNCRDIFSDFKQNAEFHKLMKEIKKNPNLHRMRPFDIYNPDKGGKDYYSDKVIDALSKHYMLIKK